MLPHVAEHSRPRAAKTYDPEVGFRVPICPGQLYPYTGQSKLHCRAAGIRKTLRIQILFQSGGDLPAPDRDNSHVPRCCVTECVASWCDTVLFSKLLLVIERADAMSRDHPPTWLDLEGQACLTYQIASRRS